MWHGCSLQTLKVAPWITASGGETPEYASPTIRPYHVTARILSSKIKEERLKVNYHGNLGFVGIFTLIVHKQNKGEKRQAHRLCNNSDFPDNTNILPVFI